MNIKCVVIVLSCCFGLNANTLQGANVVVKPEASAAVSVNKDGVILSGYDVVSYFTETRPVKGSKDFTVVYKGATYQFSSLENRDTFNANPDQYTPQYGGYSAYGISYGTKNPVDGLAYKIVDSKLYVVKNIIVYQAWKRSIAKNIELADKNWPDIKEESADKL